MSKPTSLVSIIDAQQSRFTEVSCGASGIEFEREKNFALQILGGSDYLSKVAMNNPDSLRNAVTNLSAIGISLNPASKQAYLVPRKGGVCLDISYMGMMHIAQQCGAIQWGQAVIVRQNDVFKLQAMGTLPVHEFNPFGKERGDVVGVYCVVKTDGGDYLVEAMTIDEVFAIRDRSEAWKGYKKDNSKKCPWVTDELEMVRKTVVKRASKYWPRRDRLDAAVHYLNTDGGEGFAQSAPATNTARQETDVTPVSQATCDAITDRLTQADLPLDGLLRMLSKRLRRQLSELSELYETEAQRALSFLDEQLKRAA